MPSRPTLDSLPLSKKASAAPAVTVDYDVAAADPGLTVVEGPSKPSKTKRDDKVVLMVRVSRADRKKMRQIAIADDTTVQDLVEAAVKDILETSPYQRTLKAGWLGSQTLRLQELLQSLFQDSHTSKKQCVWTFGCNDTSKS